MRLLPDGRQQERPPPVQAHDQERHTEYRRPLSIDVSEIRGFVGEGTHLKGALGFDGAVRVEGHLEGEVLRGDVLIVGERGQVNAAIEVGILQVSGQVHGNIMASQRVELLGPSRVTGTIRTPCLVIWNGAIFNGKCEMITSQGNEAGNHQEKMEGFRSVRGG